MKDNDKFKILARHDLIHNVEPKPLRGNSGEFILHEIKLLSLWKKIHDLSLAAIEQLGRTLTVGDYSPRTIGRRKLILRFRFANLQNTCSWICHATNSPAISIVRPGERYLNSAPDTSYTDHSRLQLTTVLLNRNQQVQVYSLFPGRGQWTGNQTDKVLTIMKK